MLGLGNDLLDCEMSPVTLSSIDVARDEWGRQAAQLLQQAQKNIGSRWHLYEQLSNLSYNEQGEEETEEQNA